MYREHKIGAVIPAYNVERHIKQMIEGLPAMIDRIYVVDDGSTDNTSNVIKEFSNIHLLKHEVNKGPGAAMVTGFLTALQDDMDIIVKLDGDGQMHPEQIESLISPIIEHKADYTKGDRLSNSEYQRTMPKFRLFGNFVLTYLTRIASGYWHVNDTQNGFVAMSKRALQSINMATVFPYYGYLNDILVRLNVMGFTVQDVPMRAQYGQEKSAILLRKFIPRVANLLLRSFFWRLKTRYLNIPGRLVLRKNQRQELKRVPGTRALKILVKMGHPAHVHFFKNFFMEMERAGHEVLLCATDKDVAIELLKGYGFKYIRTGVSGNSPVSKVLNLARSEYRLWQVARKFNPDILTGPMAVDVAHVSTLLRKPCIIFDDTAHAQAQQTLYTPFASVICTPTSFGKDFGSRQVRYDGCKEIAYLHPDYFKPNPSVLHELGLNENEKFVILRFVSWKAIHDIGHHGFDYATKQKLVKELGKYARVLITSESKLPDEFEKYRITVKASKMHDLLYYALLYVGEGATMASECAVLGTPAIYFNPLKLDYLEEQEKNYGLIISFTDPELSQESVVEKALELVTRDNIKEEWRAKSKKFLNDKIDVTRFMIDFIGNYPRSFYEYQARNSSSPEATSNQLVQDAETPGDAAKQVGFTIHGSPK